MEKSISITNIAKALILFQGKVDKIKKEANNPFFKSKYASLSQIQDAIQLPLMESGLAYTQLPEADDSLCTILIHAESGEYFQSTYNMRPAKSDPQALGSAITYAKRYALVAILALNIDDDDDGNSASAPAPATATQSQQTQTGKPADDNKKWLNQKTAEWTEAVKYLQTDGASITKIETKYKLSKENKAKLIEEASEVLA